MVIASLRQFNNGSRMELPRPKFQQGQVASGMNNFRHTASKLLGNYSLNSNIFRTASRPIGGSRPPRYASASQLANNNYGRVRGQHNSFVSMGPNYSYVQPSFSDYSQLSMNSNMGLGGLLSNPMAMMSMMGMLNSMGGLFNNVAAPVIKSDTLSGLGNTGAIISSGDYAGALSVATSFTEVNKIEADIANMKQNLPSNYYKIGTDAKSAIDTLIGQGTDADVGFGLAGVKINTSVFNLSRLNGDNLDEYMELIDKDITNIGDFQTKNLIEAKTKVSSLSGKLKGELTASKYQLAQLEATDNNGSNATMITALNEKIKKLEDNIAKTDAAEDAISKIDKQCTETINELKSKKTEIANAKKAEDKMKDKKYDLAKEQDTQLKKCMDDLKKIEAEITKLQKSDKDPSKVTKSDYKHADKINALIAQRTELYSTMGKLVGSLSVAGNTRFTNSKGQTYTLKYLNSAKSMLSSQSSTPATSATPATPATPTPTATPQGIQSALPEGAVVITASLSGATDSALNSMLNYTDDSDELLRIQGQINTNGFNRRNIQFMTNNELKTEFENALNSDNKYAAELLYIMRQRDMS